MKKLIQKEGIKVSLITILINFILFVFKFIAGLVSNSNAMISDAIHSLSDVLTTIIVIFGLIVANKDADYKHPYGHERIESALAIVLSFMLFITGIGIGWYGLNCIFNSSIILKVPGILALCAAIISIVVKEGMYHYTIYVAKKINSTTMKADAWHHRSDALSSIGSFIGILGARLGYPALDSICSILICILILKTAIEIFLGAVSQMIDKACDEETTEKILATIKDGKEDIDVTDLKTRLFGNKIYIDVEITANGEISLFDANRIVEDIHDRVEKTFNKVKHCNIHIIPNK